jgi:cytochrome c oxidase subunit 2
MGVFSMFPPRASANAAEVDALYSFLVVVSGVMTLLIFFFVFYFAVKYRRRSDEDRPKPIYGWIPLEIMWSVAPFLVMLIMFAWGTKIYIQHYSIPRADTLDIYVVGKQWMWKVQYPDGQREINELHVPTGRIVKLTMASEDVIHDFFIPAFRLKKDVVPGSYQTYWFQPTMPGRYRLFCAEYCGTNHSAMTGWVTVMEPVAYENWLSGGTTGGSMVEQGRKQFEQYGCVTCHVQDAKGRCPSLRDVYGKPVTLEGGGTVLADEAYIRESILNPNAKIVSGYKRDVMPVFQGQISEDSLLQLVVYIKSLSAPAPGAKPGATPGTAPAAEKRSNTK